MDRTGHVQLLLGAPGQPAPSLPASLWRLWTGSDQGPLDPAAVAASVRPSPMASRAEKALLAAVAADDVAALGRLAGQPGGAQDAARVLYAGRMVGTDPVVATEVLVAVLSGQADPSAVKILRRHWGDLHVGVTLAPGVPALIPLGRLAVGLLLAEVCAADDRPVDAVAVLRQIPAQPAVVLALAATLLAMGEHDQVIEATARLENSDDVAVLALVARSVAARMHGDLATALDAACAALAVRERNAAVMASALEERARVLSQGGNDEAARADLDAFTALASGADAVEIPPAAPLTVGAVGPVPEDDELHRARDRVRRRIMGVGAPGTFGGRHHSTYRDDVADLFSLGQLDAVEELLLGLLDAVEDEVAETGADLDPTFFLTLADLYEDRGRTDDLVALRERFGAAQARAAGPVPEATGPPAGERLPAPFDAPPPAGADAVSIDGRPVDVGAAVEHLLVSVGVAPAQEGEPSAEEAAAGSDGDERPAEAGDPVDLADLADGDDAEDAEDVANTDDATEIAEVVEVVDEAEPAADDRAGVTEAPTPAPTAEVSEHPSEVEDDTSSEADEAEARAAVARVARGPRIRSL